ncbi:hypothetical protein BDR07DRAFT_1455101 [Suillus spraguei]|nr:hypothetical protein BDR07DRAFT_1455101 [Suillus spraguei]
MGSFTSNWTKMVFNDTRNNQDQLPEGATIVPMIIASDKTPVTWHTEGLEMHPIFVTISNIQSDMWMRATCHAWQCVTYMLIPKFIDMHPDYQTILSQRLFHNHVGKLMPDPAGHDLPEQQAIACVSKVTSPIMLATSQSFGDTYRHPPRTKEHTLATLLTFW